METISADTCACYGYLIELMIKYPRLYAVMHDNYYTRGSETGWTMNKVCIFCCCMHFVLFFY